MAYPNQPESIKTFSDALLQRTVDELQKLAALASKEKKPTRKADLIAFIERYVNVRCQIRCRVFDANWTCSSRRRWRKSPTMTSRRYFG